MARRPRGGSGLGGLGRRARRCDRHCIPGRARGAGRAGDRRRPELAQSSRPHHARRTDRRQRGVSRRSDADAVVSAAAPAIGLIMLVGGRIVPSFTHNWLARNNPGRLPRPFSRFDAFALGVSALALAIWIVMPRQVVSGAALMIAGLLQAARLARWAGERTFADRLVLILHVGYAFVPIGFLLLGAAILWPSEWPMSAGLHAWTAGAIGLMTLAVMTRASLGHTGHKLAASLPTHLIYLCVVVAALARILAAFAPSSALLHVATFAWTLAFGGFAVIFGPVLLGRSSMRTERS